MNNLNIKISYLTETNTQLQLDLKNKSEENSQYSCDLVSSIGILGIGYMAC